MSGSLRKSIGPRRSAMVQRRDSALQLVAQRIPTDLAACEELLCQLNVSKNKLDDSIASFESIDLRWHQLIESVMDRTKKGEEEEYYEKVAADENDGYLTTVESCRDIQRDLEGRIKMVERQIVKLQPSKAPSKDAVTRSNNGTNRNIRAKLPKLVLPTFEGKDSMEWNQFWTIFSANVDAQEITETEKFTYLISQLRGTARDTVKGLWINDENYQVAVDLLKERFQRSKGSMVRMLYSKLKQLPCSNKSITAIRQMYNDSEAIARQLEEAGEDLESNFSLAVDILSKYPTNVVRDLAHRYSVNNDSTVSQIRSAILKYITDTEDLSESFSCLRSITESADAKSNSLSIDTDQTFSSTSTRPTSALSTVDDNKKFHQPPAGQTPVGLCYFCDGNHYNSECTTYPSAMERINQLRRRSRCERCGRMQHSTNECNRQIRCIYCQTTNQHYTALCKHKFPSTTTAFTATNKTRVKESIKPNKEDANKPSEQSKDGISLLSVTERSVLLTASCTVINQLTEKQQQARLIFDSASHRSYIRSSLADDLALESSEDEILKVSIFGTTRTLTMDSRVVSVGIHQRDGSVKTITAHTTPLITKSSVLPQSFLEEDQKLLSSMKYALAEDLEDSDGSVDILIGSEYFWDFITGSRITTTSGLLLIPSTVGLLLAGCYGSSDESVKPSEDGLSTMLCLTEKPSVSNHITALTTVSAQGKLSGPDVDEFWQLERIGINDDPTMCDDDKALSQFNDSIYQEDGRYHVKWPWIEEKKTLLPVNYELSLGRLRTLLKRFRNESQQLANKYQEVIDTQCTNGIIERVPADEVANPRYVTHYLPHHPVVKLTSATTKVRIVYDASSKCRKHCVSLNECIYRGPILLPHLCEVLIRFRSYPFVIIADVVKAFLQMALQIPDRDATRFLWIDEPKKLDSDNNIAVYRFCRVPFGVIASPFLLGATIQYHLRRYFYDNDEATPIQGQSDHSLATSARKIAQDIYVDNITCGAGSEDEAKCLQRDMKTLFGDANMDLQEYCSNSDEVLQQIPRENQAKDRTVKLLGLMWNSKQDTLCLSKRNLGTPKTTKRMILQTIASIFDPLGFFQPVTLPAKCLLQKLWEIKLDWDDPVPQELCVEWNEIICQLDGIFDQKIPRFVGSVGSDQAASIIVFCDASAKCYAAAVYQRVPNNQPEPVNLILSKSRLAPKTASITIPRLELLGVAIGIKAAQFVRKALKRDESIPIHLFTDSKVVLHWLQTRKLLAKFVANRVHSIRSVPNVTFHHVTSENNPADDCTRGKPASELMSCPQWWHGPSFLRLDVNQWPVTTHQPISSDTLSEIVNEYRPSEIIHTCNVSISAPVFATLHVGECDAPQKLTKFGIDIDRFSTWRKLLRTTTVVVKFVKRFLWNKLSQETHQRYPYLRTLFNSFSDDQSCSMIDLQTAKDWWVIAVQQIHFKDIIVAIAAKKKHSLVDQLGLRLDERGILRSYSRYKYAELQEDAKYPKLLPKSSRITTLVVEDVHKRLLHSSSSHTLCEVRREFWIPQGRAAVRRVLQRCVTCRRYGGRPFALPDMPPWPPERLACQPAFQSTGLDYLGPISVKIGDVTKKSWICLFTCLIVRAVHLEVVSDCTSKEFLDCLMRFVSRRGTPKLIISDNAPQFRTTKTVLDRVWHQTLSSPIISSYCADQGIEWRFTIELAPWQGGFYERLVQIVKRTMRVAIGRRLLLWTELVTVTAEIEAVVNTRPITYVYSDNRSRLSVIRPIQFLCDLPVRYPNIDQVDIKNTDLGEAGKLLISYWKSRQKRRRQVWDLWQSEYLLSLRERGKAKHRGHRSDVKRFPELDEVIVLRDDDAPRGAWKLARVCQLIPSNDGQIRAVVLRLPNGSSLRRAINFCYPLEIPSSSNESNIEDGDSVEDADQRDESGLRNHDPGSEPRETDGFSDEFDGFSPEDVQRTAEAVQRYRSPDQQIPSIDVHTLLSIGVTNRNRRQIQPSVYECLADQLSSVAL